MHEELEPYFKAVDAELAKYADDDEIVYQIKQNFNFIHTYFLTNIYDHTYETTCPCKEECDF